MPLVSLEDGDLPTGFGTSIYHALRVNAEGSLQLEVLLPTDNTAVAMLAPPIPYSAEDPRLLIWHPTQITFSISSNGHLRMQL